MTDRATAYAKLVVSGKRPAGKKEIQACQRHLDDLKRSKQRDFPYKYDVKQAEYHINIANQLTIAEGSEPKPLETRGFQNFILGSLFGWRKKRTNERRYREAYIQVGRQNGKSFISGELAVDFSSFSGYKHGRIYCAATKQDQANIVWDEIDKFISVDEDLSALYRTHKHNRTIVSLLTGTEIRSVGRDTKSMDGFRSILAVIDEYHAHPNNQMYKLLLDGQIKVDSALTIAITTAGFNLNGPCYKQYKMCEKVLAGAISKESLFIYITELDEEDDVWDPQNWVKANPLNLWLDDNTIDEGMLARMAEKAIDAKEKGGEELVNFLTKSLNRWVTYAGSPLVDLERWVDCAKDTNLEDMRGKQAILGIDLSSGGDLTSIALVFPLAEDKKYIYSHSFMPRLRLAEHEKTDDVPYRIWVNQGLLTLTDGGCGIKTDYKYILEHLRNLMKDYEIDIVACGYDSHNASAFLSDLMDVLGDVPIVEVKQSARSLSDATQDFGLSVKSKLVEYNKANELLTWSITNATLTSNSFGEVKVDKQAMENRIDPVDAILDAWKLSMQNDFITYNPNDEVDEWLTLYGKGVN